ncbi:hypothetical protein [Bacillus sp. MMSF_3328]|uniref:hypothetical protein n=1 Tax=Bacillus sp. MMSF_3328 TaxID=3047080 RepID=UPI00273FD7F4|nr:hypothetical protein [Bacillus sp. MMSF_3328]
MKKYGLILLIILFSFSTSAFAQPETASLIPSEEQFLKLVKKTEEYKDFKDDFLSNDPYILNPLKDEKDQQYGWIVQYEIKYKEEASLAAGGAATVSFSSILTFAYDSINDDMQAYIIDYSSILKDQAIYLEELSTGTTTAINVSETDLYAELAVQTEEKAESMVSSAGLQSGNPAGEEGVNGSNYLCWQCTSYTNGSVSLPCANLVGSYCSSGSQYSVGRLLCAGKTIIDCYVPKDKVCVKGVWKTTCPAPA